MAGAGTLNFSRLRGKAVIRDPNEEHRASTPLELLFDLTYVVAVGRAAEALHHELAVDHIYDGLTGFVTLFFAVWWGWMNFTWFASAHDADDVPYRLLTLVQMAGALVLASGVTRAMEDGDFVVVTIGYAIMRIGLISSWLRVARDQRDSRQRALRFAGALAGLQVLWLVRLALPHGVGLGSFAVLALAELAIPMWAEKANGQPIFHPEHIEERYGLFTLIVLGESILSAAAGFQIALDEAGLTAGLLTVGLGGLVLAFASWWLYFDHPGHLAPTPAQGFRWGYGHALIFLSLAALGAGIHFSAEAVTGHGDTRVASLSVAVPMASYLLGLALVIVLTGASAGSVRVVPKLAGAIVIVVIGLVASVPVTVAGCAGVLAVLAAWMIVTDPPPAQDDPSGFDERLASLP